MKIGKNSALCFSQVRSFKWNDNFSLLGDHLFVYLFVHWTRSSMHNDSPHVRQTGGKLIYSGKTWAEKKNWWLGLSQVKYWLLWIQFEVTWLLHLFERPRFRVVDFVGDFDGDLLGDFLGLVGSDLTTVVDAVNDRSIWECLASHSIFCLCTTSEFLKGITSDINCRARKEMIEYFWMNSSSQGSEKSHDLDSWLNMAICFRIIITSSCGIYRTKQLIQPFRKLHVVAYLDKVNKFFAH